jgi:hypothetical protein
LTFVSENSCIFALGITKGRIFTAQGKQCLIKFVQGLRKASRRDFFYLAPRSPDERTARNGGAD